MRRGKMQRRTWEAALPKMTSGNKEEADVRGGGEKEDGCVETRQRMSSNNLEE